MVATQTQHSTLNDIAPEARARMVALLNQQLADTFDLYSQVKQAHWNVKGMNFIALHELFDDVAGKVLEFVDELAERATALGGDAQGTVRQAASLSRLPEFPSDIKGGEAFVQAVIERVAAYTNSARAAVEEADDADDVATEDLLTEITREMDKLLWFLEAHLQ